MWHLPVRAGAIAVLLGSLCTIGVQTECAERLEGWAKAAVNVPRSGWVTSTNVTYYPDSHSGDKGRGNRTNTRRAVVQDAEYLVVEDVTPGTGNSAAFTRVFIANTDYLAQLKRIGDGPWVMEKLSIYTDADFAKHRKVWFRLDPMHKFGNYHGTLSVLLSGEYVVTDQKSDGGRERIDVRVTEGPKHEDYAVTWSDMESLSAVFERDKPIPVEISGKERGRNRYFSRTLSDWEEVDGALVPLMQVLKTDDKDQPALAVQKRTLDFSEYAEPVNASVFYLSHYGLPEPELKTRLRSKLLYGFAAVSCLAVLGWMGRRRWRHTS